MKNTTLYQPGILEPVPPVARYVLFNLAGQGVNAQAIKEAFARLSPMANGSDVVLGIGPSLVEALGASIPGLHPFPDLSGNGVRVPATPATLWCWVRGEDLGDLLHLTRRVQKALAPVFVVRHVVDAFRHALGESGHGKDLTGYEDGTENPKGEAAEEAAFAHGEGEGLDGSSYVAVQQWVHDLDAFDALASEEQDRHFGRRRSDNLSHSCEYVRHTPRYDSDGVADLLRHGR
jgi:putative iron-dependent peroxidase